MVIESTGVNIVLKWTEEEADMVIKYVHTSDIIIDNFWIREMPAHSCYCSYGGTSYSRDGCIEGTIGIHSDIKNYLGSVLNGKFWQAQVDDKKKTKIDKTLDKLLSEAKGWNTSKFIPDYYNEKISSVFTDEQLKKAEKILSKKDSWEIGKIVIKFKDCCSPYYNHPKVWIHSLTGLGDVLDQKLFWKDDSYNKESIRAVIDAISECIDNVTKPPKNIESNYAPAYSIMVTRYNNIYRVIIDYIDPDFQFYVESKKLNNNLITAEKVRTIRSDNPVFIKAIGGDENMHARVTKALDELYKEFKEI